MTLNELATYATLVHDKAIVAVADHDSLVGNNGKSPRFRDLTPNPLEEAKKLFGIDCPDYSKPVVFPVVKKEAAFPWRMSSGVAGQSRFEPYRRPSCEMVVIESDDDDDADSDDVVVVVEEKKAVKVDCVAGDVVDDFDIALLADIGLGLPTTIEEIVEAIGADIDLYNKLYFCCAFFFLHSLQTTTSSPSIGFRGTKNVVSQHC